MRSYVAARMLWDTNTDVERAVNEFLAGVYGPGAAKPLRAWFDLLHRQVRMPPRGAGRHMWTYGSPRLSREVLDSGQELFRKAEASAEGDAARARVRKARLPVDYAELLAAKEYRLRGDVYAPEDLAGLKLRFAAFMASLKEHGGHRAA